MQRGCMLNQNAACYCTFDKMQNAKRKTQKRCTSKKAKRKTQLKRKTHEMQNANAKNAKCETQNARNAKRTKCTPQFQNAKPKGKDTLV